MVAIKKKIGIVGGTFDPIHRGHIYLITEILNRKLFDYLIILPAGNPWMKPEGTRASSLHRFAMVKAALDELTQDQQRSIVLSDSEINREGPSYAIDTLTELLKKEAAADFTWVLGTDAARHLLEWKRFDELKNLISFLVISRNTEEVISIPGVALSRLDIQALPISATQVRSVIAAGHGVSDLVTPKVAAYIKEENLYASA